LYLSSLKQEVPRDTLKSPNSNKGGNLLALFIKEGEETIAFLREEFQAACVVYKLYVLPLYTLLLVLFL